LILAVETFELAWSGRDRLAHLADELCRTLVETDHRALRIGLFSIEVEHVLHAGDIVGVDLRNAPHVLAPWFQVIFGQAPAHGLTRKADVLGEAAHRTRQQLQRPTSAALRALEQAVATSRASSLPESLRPAPGRGCSLSAASRLPTSKSLCSGTSG